MAGGYEPRRCATSILDNIHRRAVGRQACVRVYDLYELEARIRKEAAFHRFTAHVNGDARTNALAMQITTGSRPVSASQVETLDEVRSVSSREKKELSNLILLLYPQDIKPGETIAGVVKLHAEDITHGIPLQIDVSVGEERHTFTLSVGN